MASVEECREALTTLSHRLTEMSPQDRASYFGNRSMSCHVTDLGVTFVTRFTDSGTEPVTEAKPDDPPADIRLTASSDDVKWSFLRVRDPQVAASTLGDRKSTP